MHRFMFIRVSATALAPSAFSRLQSTTAAAAAAAAAASASDPTTITTPRATESRYVVHRTINKSLPVYSEYKNGDTRRLTIIRRIEGDVDTLKQELDAVFGADNVRINRLNNHIIVKGIVVPEVRQFLTQKGF